MSGMQDNNTSNSAKTPSRHSIGSWHDDWSEEMKQHVDYEYLRRGLREPLGKGSTVTVNYSGNPLVATSIELTGVTHSSQHQQTELCASAAESIAKSKHTISKIIRHMHRIEHDLCLTQRELIRAADEESRTVNATEAINKMLEDLLLQRKKINGQIDNAVDAATRLERIIASLSEPKAKAVHQKAKI
ncbi:uncharacterized protein LOC135944374 [Cloeon dipterum]|uniref:uncharacterized protein LOC135936619 n=1 Tax=Cloeon dipterum TaxID=197152 RepID=UPI00321FBEFE